MIFTLFGPCRLNSYSYFHPASGILAYGTSTGAVGLVEITQTLVEKEDSLFGPEYLIQMSVQDMGLIHQPDKSGLTALRWIIPRTGSVRARRTLSVTSTDCPKAHFGFQQTWKTVPLVCSVAKWQLVRPSNSYIQAAKDP